MRKSAEITRVVFILMFLFLFICLPVVIIRFENWFNILLLVLGFTFPIIVGGLLLSRYKYLQNPFPKFLFTWLIVGIAFFLTSSIILFLTNHNWNDILLNSTKLAIVAMTIGLVWHLISMAFRKIFSLIKKR